VCRCWIRVCLFDAALARQNTVAHSDQDAVTNQSPYDRRTDAEQSRHLRRPVHTDAPDALHEWRLPGICAPATVSSTGDLIFAFLRAERPDTPS